MSSSPEDGIAGGVAFVMVIIALAIAGVVYFIVIFVSGLVGVVRQLANPEAIFETNATVLLAMHPVFVVLAYVSIPEFPPGFSWRFVTATWIGVVPTVALTLILFVVLPALAGYAPWEFASALFLVFLAFGVLPTLALSRLVVALHPELRVAKRGDHYIDATALGPDLRRIAAKHTAGRFRRPAGWSRPSFWGDRGRLTVGDLIRMIELETAEQGRLQALYKAASAAARQERAAAEARFLGRLDDESQALVSIYFAHLCGSKAAAHATHARPGEAEPCPSKEERLTSVQRPEKSADAPKRRKRRSSRGLS
jgi:hypothetical protein